MGVGCLDKMFNELGLNRKAFSLYKNNNILLRSLTQLYGSAMSVSSEV